MRLALRVLITLLNSIEAQLDNVDNELRAPAHTAYRTKFGAAKRQLRLAIRAFADLNDELGDAGIN